MEPGKKKVQTSIMRFFCKRAGQHSTKAAEVVDRSADDKKNSPAVAAALSATAASLNWHQLQQHVAVVESTIRPLSYAEYDALQQLLTPLCAATSHGNTFQHWRETAPHLDWRETAPHLARAAAERIAAGPPQGVDETLCLGGQMLQLINDDLLAALQPAMDELGLEMPQFRPITHKAHNPQGILRGRQCWWHLSEFS